MAYAPYEIDEHGCECPFYVAWQIYYNRTAKITDPMTLCWNDSVNVSQILMELTADTNPATQVLRLQVSQFDGQINIRTGDHPGSHTSE